MDPQPQPVPSGPLLPYILAILVFLLSLSTMYLSYQNIQLQKQVTFLQNESAPTPTPYQTPTPTCRPRPGCLDSSPRCMMPESSDMCPYSCPANGYVDCMPGPDKNMRKCSAEAMTWYKANCPNFRGGAL